MDWLRALHPDYWFFRGTRNSFERYWGEGQGWNGFFSAWFTGAFVAFILFVMMTASSPGFPFVWQSFAALGVVSLFMSFFFIPFTTAFMLAGAFVREEVKNRRESHRRFNEAILKAASRRCKDESEKK